MFKPEEIFDALLNRAADRETMRLFGDMGEKENRAALQEKLCGRPFSQLFLEFPLAGTAGFDLHVIFDSKDIRQGVPFPADIYGSHGQLFSWFGGKDRGKDGLDVVYDLRDGMDTPPMVYLKTRKNETELIDGFFAHAGAAEAAMRFREKRALLPAGWDTWYTGVHTGRKGKPLRIGSFLSNALKERYAKNIGLFEETIAAVGFPSPLSHALGDKLRELFRFPFEIDIQLDVMEDGSIGDTLGISLLTGSSGRNALAESFASGAARDVMLLLEEWGVADDRWQHIPAATYQVAATVRSADGDKRRFVLTSHLAFLKVRFRGTGALAHDAKAYLNLQHKEAFQ